MTRTISETRISRLSEFVAERLGLHFPPERWSDLARGITSAASEFGFKDAEACIDWLASSSHGKEQIEVMASHLTVGETYFFREKNTFEALETHILPELISSRRNADRRLRIWSAGCATGEEPYSLAIVLARMLGDSHDWNITILASDINPRFLRKAEAGVYNQWSFRNSPSEFQQAWFEKTRDGRFELLPRIKKKVAFCYLNLAEDVYPSLLNNTNAMDIIFCRNVLMYFSPKAASQVVRNFHRALTDGGWLIVSPSEASHLLYSGFETVNPFAATLYRKGAERLAPAQPVTEALEPPLTWIPMSADPLPQMELPEAPTPPPAGTREPETNEPPAPAEKAQPEADQQAFMLCMQGRYGEAAVKILDWLAEKPGDAKAMAMLARVYANQGKLQEALEWCEKAVAVEKVDAGIHYLRATILLEQGMLDRARESLQCALYIDQDFVLVHFVLGNLARRQGNVRAFRKHFENALSVLSAYGLEQALPESEGITAGRLKGIIAREIDSPDQIREAVADKKEGVNLFTQSGPGSRTVRNLK